MQRPVLIVGGVALVTLVAGVAVAASASAGTVTYEAEAARNTLNGGAHTVDCRRCSGGRRIGGLGGDGALSFAGVMAEDAGSTKIAVTYTSPEARTAQISVNGSVPTAIAFPATRGVGRPGVLKVTVTLQAGANNLTFGNPAGAAPDLDKIVVTTDGTPPLPVPTGTTPGDPGATATLPPGVPPPSDSGSGSAPPPPTSSGSPSAPPADQSPSAQPPTAQPTTGQPPTGRPPTGKPSPQPTATASTAKPNGDSALEAAVVALVNKERSAAGCRAVAADARLTAAARGHSADMAARGYFSHTSPEGVKFSTRLTDAGYRWSAAGENIAKGQRTAQDVMTGWMNSSGHKANIVNCNFTDIGVGVVADARGSLVWTQDFAKPR